MRLGRVLQGKAPERFSSSLSGLHSLPGTHPGTPHPSPELARTWGALVRSGERSPRAPSTDRLDPSASHPGVGTAAVPAPNARTFHRRVVAADTPPTRAPQFRSTCLPAPPIAGTPCALPGHRDGEGTARAGRLAALLCEWRMVTLPTGCRSRWPGRSPWS